MLGFGLEFTNGRVDLVNFVKTRGRNKGDALVKCFDRSHYTCSVSFNLHYNREHRTNYIGECNLANEGLYLFGLRQVT